MTMIWNELPVESGNIAIKLARSCSIGAWSWVKDSSGDAGIALEMKESVNIDQIPKSRYFNVREVKVDGLGHLLMITCSDKGLLNTFQSFCEDLMASTESAGTLIEGISLVANRIALWSKLFSRLGGMTKSKAYGLIGELCFLHHWLDAGNFIKDWLGSSDSSQDFISSTLRKAVEVKSIGSKSSIAHISSLDQLDYEGDLYLVIYKIQEISDDPNVVTLNTLVKSILDRLEYSDKTLFSKKLLEYGYHSEDAMASLTIKVDGPYAYEVSGSFPKVTRSSIPTEIFNCSYEINISQCINYAIKNEVLFEVIKQ